MEYKRISALRGMKDILPEEVGLWVDLEKKSRRVLYIYGYKEIRTPILEESSLFIRSIGEGTDIVQKEMFRFKDRGGRDITLRPEGTASIARAFIEHSFHKKSPVWKLFYIGPMFRSERPQAGRLRQFHQIGVEAIGSASAYMDAEIITLMLDLIKEFGLNGCKIRLNTLGCPRDKHRYNQILKEVLFPKKQFLCQDCKVRLEHNILRVFDCKNPACKTILKDMPKISENICEDCSSHFKHLQDILTKTDIKFLVDPGLVRGLDYYTKTGFEVIHNTLGAQDAVGAGGRYDGLISELGGTAMPACGFAIGFERLVLALEKSHSVAFEDNHRSKGICVITLGQQAKMVGFDVLQKLRSKGIKANMSFEEQSLKSQMRAAQKAGARGVVIIGEEELKKNRIILKDMEKKTQSECRMDDIVDKIIQEGLC